MLSTNILLLLIYVNIILIQILLPVRFWNLDLSFTDTIIFPLLNPASRHDFRGFLRAFFRMKNGVLKPNIKTTLPLAKMVFLFVKKVAE